MNYKYKSQQSISSNEYRYFTDYFTFDIDRIYQDIKLGVRPSKKTFYIDFDYIMKLLKDRYNIGTNNAFVVARGNNKLSFQIFEMRILELYFRFIKDYINYVLNSKSSVPRVHYDRYFKIPFEKFVRLKI